jgi:hypothetical protein
MALAQDAPDLLGKWTFEINGLADDLRCGEISEIGEMHVTRKIAARAYRGKVRSQQTSARCSGVVVGESAVTVRIRDNKVTVDYDEEDWTMDTLVLSGDEMSGRDSDGVASHWVREIVTHDQSGSSATPDTGHLETILGEIEPILTAELRSEFGKRLQRGVERSGLSEEEAGQVVDRTIERMTTCVLDSVREKLRAQGIPLGESVANNRTVLVLDPRRMDFKNMECIQDAGQNAGVTIR